MDERQCRGVEQLARRERLEPFGFHARRRGHAPAAAERVLAVTDDRATHVRQMHANLMRPAGAETDAQQIGVGEAGYDTRVGHRVTATLRDRHAFALLGMPRDRGFDVDRALAQVPPHDRRIHARDFTSFDRPGEAAVREIALRHHQQS